MPATFKPAVGGSRGPNRARAGMQSIMRNYANLIRHIEGVTPEILYEALEPTFELSKEYCPKDTGALVQSGYLVIASRGQVSSVEIGYGRGGNPKYAVNVHENVEWRHKAPTRAKWLQIALSEDASEIQYRIRNSFKKAGGF